MNAVETPMFGEEVGLISVNAVETTVFGGEVGLIFVNAVEMTMFGGEVGLIFVTAVETTMFGEEVGFIFDSPSMLATREVMILVCGYPLTFFGNNWLLSLFSSGGRSVLSLELLVGGGRQKSAPENLLSDTR